MTCRGWSDSRIHQDEVLLDMVAKVSASGAMLVHFFRLVEACLRAAAYPGLAPGAFIPKRLLGYDLLR